MARLRMAAEPEQRAPEGRGSPTRLLPPNRGGRAGWRLYVASQPGGLLQYLIRVPILRPRAQPSARLTPPSRRMRSEEGIGSVAQFGDDPERLLPARDAFEIVKGVTPALPMIVPGRTRA